MDPLRNGSVVADRYHLVRQLSQRAHAAVWQCTDATAGGRLVAVKVYAEGRAVDSFVIDMLREEFGSTSIKHPHILMPTEVGLDRGVPYLVMPLVAAGSYADLLQKSAGRPVLDERTALTTLGSLSSAISYLHRKNYVHQDVTTSNVLVGEGGIPLLSDFGLNRILHNSLGHAGRPGTLYHPAYASPERAQGHSASASDDVFSLAVVMYELITGMMPWNGLGGRALLDGADPLVSSEYLSDAALAMLRRCTDPDADSRPTIAEIERWAAAYKPPAAHVAPVAPAAPVVPEAPIVPVAATAAVTTGDAVTVRADAERKLKEDAERKAKEDAERKAKEDAERKAKEDAERKEKADTERKAKKEDAERKAKEDAERKAKDEAERKAKEEAERKAREDVERKAKEDAERKAKEEAERKAKKEEAERKAKEEAERKARAEAERAARIEAEQKLLEDIARKAREEAERAERVEAERKARREEERRTRKEADRRKREEADRAAREIAERRKREEQERRARDEAERARRADEERRAREDAERARREEEERRTREEADRRTREEAERIAAEHQLADDEVEVLDREELERKILEEAERKARTLLEQAIALHPENTMAREEIVQRIRDEVETRVREEFGQQKGAAEQAEVPDVEVRKDDELSRLLDSITSEVGELVPTALPAAAADSPARHDDATRKKTARSETAVKRAVPEKIFVRSSPATGSATKSRSDAGPRRSIPTWLLVALPLLLAGAAAWYLLRDTGDAAVAARIRLHAPGFRDSTLVADLVAGWFAAHGADDITTTRRAGVTAYQALFPDDSVRVIEVTTGSAAAGLASLARGDCDIVLSSRPCTRSEMDALGSVAAWEGESALALQALAVVVRRDHPRATISMRELLRLRTSQAPTREQLPLVLPPSGSDADDMLRALLPPDAALIAEDQRAVSDTEFRERILTMPDAIGFTSLPVPEGLRALRISDGQGDATSASIDALRGSTYPLVTALHAYTRPGAEAPAVVDLVRHLASEANDEILTRHALVPPAVHFVSGGDRHAAAPTLRARVKGAQRMSTVLHLRQGSTEFDPFSQRALVALARHLETNPHEVIVIGFSDQLGGDSGDLVSKTLAEKAAGELRARGITPAHVIGAGSAVPVADDGRPGGRERNRRVEIWIRTTSDSPTSR